MHSKAFWCEAPSLSCLQLKGENVTSLSRKKTWSRNRGIEKKKVYKTDFFREMWDNYFRGLCNVREAVLLHLNKHANSLKEWNSLKKGEEEGKGEREKRSRISNNFFFSAPLKTATATSGGRERAGKQAGKQASYLSISTRELLLVQ